MVTPPQTPAAAPPVQADDAMPEAAAPRAPEGLFPLEADRVAINMPLVDTLVMLAGHYGRRTSRATLTAGLPIPTTGITPDLFIRAAERANLGATVVERALGPLVITPLLPCILVLNGQQACVLWDVVIPKGKRPQKKLDGTILMPPGTKFIVQFPETPDDKKSLAFDELKNLYSGYAFFVRPVARIDDRAGPGLIDTKRSWFWESLLEHRGIYKEVVLAAVLINVFALASPLFTMNVYDRVVPNSAFETLWVLAAGMVIMLVFDLIIKTLRAQFLDYAGKKADIKISALLHEQMLGMTLAARPASAGVLASNMREFESIRDFFTSATLAAIIDLPFVFLFIAVIAIIAGPLAIVPLAAVPIVLLISWALQVPMAKITKSSMMESALKNAQLFETITGLETIKTQAAEGHVQRKWEELNERAAKTAAKSKRVSTFAANFSGFVQQVVGVIVVIVGVYLISVGYITMGALIAAVMLTSRALSPLSQFSALLIRYNQTREGLKQLDELMKKPVERPMGKHFVSLPRVAGRVEFKDVVFAYPGQTMPALNHVSFAVEPGEHLGIIGAVGSGKTTLQRLLLNMYQPSSGSVQIDTSDVRQIDPGDLRRNVGCVQQSPQLFYGSVRENITMGHETAPDRAVVRAAELSGVMDFLRDSQLGLDTQVGERGEALSGGQRQAVAIARALLYDPPIMILDEPTASMDPASENRLRSHLEVITRGKTTLLITHKGAMLSLVDRIMLLDRGRILAIGPRDEIIRKLQSRDYTPGKPAS
jgi:ATP-binding cassette subfamily C protein LapB